MQLRFRYARPAVLAVLAAATLAACIARAGVPVARPPRPSVAPARDLRHPIDVHVTASGPVAHGATVRLHVAVTPVRALERAEVRLVSSGGAALSGRREASLGAVRRDEARAADFEVVIPATGRQFLVQFQVSGQSEGATLTRGATYNLLPDGPAEVGRRVQGPDGSVLEFGARRIAR